MARINVEVSIFKENRFINLCIAAGSRINGIGAMVCLWLEAQKFHLKYGEIPNAEWVKSGLPEYLITTGWAERTPTGVRAKGQDEAFAWLEQRSNAGKSKSEKKTKNLKQNTERNGGECPNGTERPPNLLSPSSLLSSPSSSLNTHISNLGTVPAAGADALASDPELPLGDSPANAGPAPEAPKPPRSRKPKVVPEKTLGSKIFESYARAYKAKYRDDPVRDKAANSLCKAIGESLGEEGIQIAAWYVGHPKAFYAQAYHPLTLLKQDGPALRTQWRTGRIITTGEARAGEQKQHALNAFGSMIEPEGGANGDPE